jgi:adenylate cyclase
MSLANRHSFIRLAICAAGVLLALVLWRRGCVPLQEAEWNTQDLRARLGRRTAVDPRLVLIGVDRPRYEQSYFDAWEFEKTPALRGLLETYPWSREVWAELITRLADAGAKTIVIDLVFAAPKNGDDALAAALEKYRDRIVIGCNFSSTETERGNVFELDVPSATLIPADVSSSTATDDRVGYVNIWTDDDSVLRSAHYRHTGDQLGNLFPPTTVLESLDARALRKFGHAGLIPAGYEPRLFRYTAPGGYGYVPLPVGEVLSPKLWKNVYHDGAAFRDKLVLIGPTANLFQDKHHIPLKRPEWNGKETSTEMPGPEIHLNIINAALHGEFLREASALASGFTIVLAGLLAGGFCFTLRQPLRRLAAVALATVAYWFLAQRLFNAHGLIILVVAPVAVFVGASGLVLTYDFFVERRDKARVRKTLERYVSKNVVKELLDNPATFFNSLTGVRKPVAILFSDVRGFTTLTESADSAQLVKQLNEYFEEMVRLVFAHNGSLDKFIGDAVMAVWGNIVSESPAQDARRAVATALAMRKSLEQLNASWKARGWQELHIGIGINHGEVIVGNLGSTEKMELTVIGDAVNLASRLEGLTKEYRLDLLLGENVARLVGDTYILRLVDCVQVKGKTKPVDVFTVMGEGAGQTVSLPVWLARYEEGVRRYRQREFADAAKLFEVSVSNKPDDYLSAMYLARCRALIENPPGESWDGVFVMTKK